MARFENKVVLVSGGARGQGAAEARMLAANGAKVVIGDVLESEGHVLAEEIGPAAVFLRHDVTEEAGWARAVEAAQHLGGGLHGACQPRGHFICRSHCSKPTTPSSSAISASISSAASWA